MLDFGLRGEPNPTSVAKAQRHKSKIQNPKSKIGVIDVLQSGKQEKQTASE
jgi:hypothetical protein